jgi:5-enolpyruvylshikimate-3-phosphate synthase
MPACMATGQAAGIAAAIALEGNTTVRQVPIDRVQSALREIGMPLHAEDLH